MAFDLDRKKLYIGGGVLALLIVGIIIIVYACSGGSKAVADYSNFKITTTTADGQVTLFESYVKGEDRDLAVTTVAAANSVNVKYYLINKDIWKSVDRNTCQKISDNSIFTKVDKIRDQALASASKIIFHKDDGIIIANVEEYEVTVTKKSGIFQQIILKTSTVTNTVDLNQKPPNETFDCQERATRLDRIRQDAQNERNQLI